MTPRLYPSGIGQRAKEERKARKAGRARGCSGFGPLLIRSAFGAIEGFASERKRGHSKEFLIFFVLAQDLIVGAGG